MPLETKSHVWDQDLGWKVTFYDWFYNSTGLKCWKNVIVEKKMSHGGGGPKSVTYYLNAAMLNLVLTGLFGKKGQTNLSHHVSLATHLSNQLYSICFRRNVGKCSLCFIPSVNVATATISLQVTSFSGFLPQSYQIPLRIIKFY